MVASRLFLYSIARRSFISSKTQKIACTVESTWQPESAPPQSCTWATAASDAPLTDARLPHVEWKTRGNCRVVDRPVWAGRGVVECAGECGRALAEKKANLRFLNLFSTPPFTHLFASFMRIPSLPLLSAFSPPSLFILCSLSLSLSKKLLFHLLQFWDLAPSKDARHPGLPERERSASEAGKSFPSSLTFVLRA
ncbi:hypothetical protein LR48_Vigan11g081100 [Vigna angularis]|uniref:Uncharacterized protein n=1 Tax=Phaseolus angularis TaxID=3914 RepID=A0A0L9VS50_PHAAN|nr:hypothetical protein LR48_Vigan11g081100 [Vigna angularis]